MHLKICNGLSLRKWIDLLANVAPGAELCSNIAAALPSGRSDGLLYKHC